MGVLDDIKDSFSRSDSSGSGSGGFDSDFGDSDFDQSFQDDSPGNDFSGGNAGGNDFGNSGNPPGGQAQGQQGPGQQEAGDPGLNQPQGRQQGQNPPQPGQNTGNRQQNTGNPPRNQGRDMSRGGQDTGLEDSPNPQTGRPQQGGTKPQLSQQTEKKMENAGLEPAKDDVSAEIDELKRQNEQIIDLLERIADSMQSGSRGQQGRHGGRR